MTTRRLGLEDITFTRARLGGFYSEQGARRCLEFFGSPYKFNPDREREFQRTYSTDYSDNLKNRLAAAASAYQRFQIGDKVKALAFTDSGGKWNDEVTGLTVESVQYVDNEHAPHWRCKAVKPDGFGWVEGNQNHFVEEV